MKSKWKKKMAAAACATSVLAAGVAAQAESYTFSDLGNLSRSLFSNYTLQMPVNEAYSINDNGQVVGVLKGRFGTASATHIITWSSTGGEFTATDFGTQPLSPTYSSTKCGSYGINNAGKIVGYVQPTSQSWYAAFLYDTTTKTATNLLKPGGSSQAVATAVNDSNVVVGYTGEGGNIGPYAPPAAFVYRDGVNKRIPGATFGTVVDGSTTNGSIATAISNTGLVTGFSTVGNTARTFIYDTAQLTSDLANSTSLGFQSLGTLAGLSDSTQYFGIDINNSGAVVGYTSDTAVMGGVIQIAPQFNNVTNPHAFIYTNATGMTQLAELGGAGAKANAINNAGIVVGSSNGRAVVWEGGNVYDLNSLIGAAAETGFTLTSALDINNLGQIVGYGTNAAGEERAFALTLTPTPIPPAFLLFGSGLSGMLFIRRRKTAA